jgi:hypothetical protein
MVPCASLIRAIVKYAGEFWQSAYFFEPLFCPSPLFLSARPGTKQAKSEDWHLDITPKTASGWIDRLTHLLGNAVDIGNVNGRHLRTEVK